MDGLFYLSMEYTDINTLKVKDLKEILKKNGQLVSGNKSQLQERVLDGRKLGKIPKCISCYGGTPKFDPIKKIYKCPGYRDDDDSIFCNRRYAFNDLKREKWEE